MTYEKNLYRDQYQFLRVFQASRVLLSDHVQGAAILELDERGIQFLLLGAETKSKQSKNEQTPMMTEGNGWHTKGMGDPEFCPFLSQIRVHS